MRKKKKKVSLLKIFRNIFDKTHQRILIISIMRNLRFIFLMTQEKKLTLKSLKGYSGKKKKPRSGENLIITTKYRVIRNKRTAFLLQMRPLYNRWGVLGWEFYQEEMFWLLDSWEIPVVYCPCKKRNSVTKRRSESLATLLVLASGHSYSTKTRLSEVTALQKRCQQIPRQD